MTEEDVEKKVDALYNLMQSWSKYELLSHLILHEIGQLAAKEGVEGTQLVGTVIMATRKLENRMREF